jgi:SAM-dependent methyltransferase
MARKVRKSAESHSEEDVRRAVKERYTELATKQAPCCGSEKSTMCGCSGLYPDEDVLSLPPEAAAVSAGCGNPTAIAELREGMVVVDLGSGGGIDAFLSSKKVGPKGRVYGIDATPEMIHRARRTAKEHGFSNVEFRLGEIEHMPLPDGCADVVISNCVINLSPQKQQVFDEAFRVLRSGGKLAVSDIVLLKELPERLRGDMAAWSSCVSGAVMEEEYLAAIRKAGFSGVKVEDRVVYTHEQLKAYISPGGEGAPITSFSPVRDEEDLSGIVASSRVTARKP